MQDANSNRQRLRQRDDYQPILERFNRRMEDYVREHPEAGQAEVVEQIKWLEVAMPGLTEAFSYQTAWWLLMALDVRSRGDGLPRRGPSTERDADGQRLWKPPDEWTLDDYHVTLAWFREPMAPAMQLTALIAYGERRWPGEDMARQPWPDTSDLPSWEDLAPYLIEEADIDADNAPDRQGPIPPV
jgi:hypothetical protein